MMSREIQLQYKNPSEWMDAFWDETKTGSPLWREWNKTVQGFQMLPSVLPFATGEERVSASKTAQWHRSEFNGMYQTDSTWNESSLKDAEKYFNVQALFQARYNKSDKNIQDYYPKAGVVLVAPQTTPAVQHPRDAYPEPLGPRAALAKAASNKKLVTLAFIGGMAFFLRKGKK